MLNGSVPQLVQKLWHKRHFFPVPYFFHFVKKTHGSVATNFFKFIMDGDGKKNLELQFLNFISLIWIKENTVKHFKKVCTGLQSIDGLKSLKPLEIVIKTWILPLKYLTVCKDELMLQIKMGYKGFWSSEVPKWIV